MSKRTDGKFERRDRDFYATPVAATLRLLPFIQDVTTFAEPMCGDGAIVKALENGGWECVGAWDLEPQGSMIGRAGVRDAGLLQAEDLEGADAIISNPPWPMPVKSSPQGSPPGWPTVGLIDHLMRLRPTWMLLSADFCHNAYAVPLLAHCTDIVSVGRVKWIEGSKHSGLDNASWYRFWIEGSGPPRFHNRGAEPAIYHPDLEKIL